MAFKQYTKCIAPNQFSTLNPYLAASMAAGVTGAAFTGMALLAGQPWCILLVVEITSMAWIVAFCDWWLNGRLICLGGDVSAVGMLVSIEPATGKPFPESFDTDLSINLLLYDNDPGVAHTDAEQTGPYGHLMAEQAATRDLGVGFVGYHSTDKANDERSAVFHGEFEGAGIRDLMIGAEIGFWGAVAAFIACIVIPFPVGPLVAAALAILALFALLIGGLAGLKDTGETSDVDPEVGPLHTNDPSADGLGADLLYMSGTWIYDSLHDGWNEIHPIKVVSRVGRWDGEWPNGFGTTVDEIERGFADAGSDETREEQDRPEHHWTHHPSVDGCLGEPEPEP